MSLTCPNHFTDLVHSDVVPVNGGMCVSCVFASGSTAKGCAIRLYNDRYTFNFNMSHQSSDDIALLECFTVPEMGLFHVAVSEIDSENYNSLELPYIMIGLRTANTAEKVNGTIVSLALCC